MNDVKSLSHSKWRCKYHIVFAPKYRRKIIYGQYKESIRDILRQLCAYKGVEILEGHLMPDHVHMIYFLFRGLGKTVRFPSICSWRSSFIGACIGSRIKSTPSRRASFAAGTKSLSPDISTIRDACFL